VALLEEQSESRVQELVPIRYGRMLVSPFTFYRGAAGLMAADLAEAPRTNLTVQLCGDAHLSNFGTYMAPDRRLTFSLNDFDETLPGPFEWDVKRLVASFEVAGRDRGLSAKQRVAVDLAATRAYREGMQDLATRKRMDTWYARLDVDEIKKLLAKSATAPRDVKRFNKNVAKAQTKDSLKAFDKLVEDTAAGPRLISDPPLIVRLEDLASDTDRDALEGSVRSILQTYRRSLQGDRRHLLEGFHYADTARKVVGVGSVGTRAWIVLLFGHGSDDPLFLQAKEAQESVLEPYLGKSRHANHGQRIVEGQRLMQSASDIFLGWVRTVGLDGVSRDFYVRQLWDGKGSAVVEAMDLAALTAYARLCGWTMARAHARSGDAAAIASYLGSGESFDRAIATFAASYADQNEKDYAALKQAASSGQISTQVA